MPNLPMMSPGVSSFRVIPVQFFPADLSREADDLRGHLPVQVLPDGRHLGHHAGKFEAWVSTTASFSMLMFRSKSTGTKGFILPVKELNEGGFRERSV